jgi:chemotaxis methyl-accepting protein methylase
MDRATQSNPAKSDHTPLPPRAGGTLEEVPRVAAEVRRRVHLNGGGREWQFEDQVRRMPRLEPSDLRRSVPTKGPFGVVGCRNVPIHFKLETGRQILREIRGAMFRLGHPLPGGAETTFDVDDRFGARPSGSLCRTRRPRCRR